MISVLLILFILAMFFQQVMTQAVLLGLVLFFITYLKLWKQVYGNRFTLGFIILFTLFFHMVVRFEQPYLYWFLNTTLWMKALFFTLRNVNIIIIMLGVVSNLSERDPLELIQSIEKFSF